MKSTLTQTILIYGMVDFPTRLGFSKENVSLKYDIKVITIAHIKSFFLLTFSISIIFHEKLSRLFKYLDQHFHFQIFQLYFTFTLISGAIANLSTKIFRFCCTEINNNKKKTD